jgi:hypothetical protein
VGEFIVGLQVVQSNVHGLRLRIMAESTAARCGWLWRRSRYATDEARGVLRWSASAAAQHCASELVEQAKQLRGLAAG